MNPPDIKDWVSMLCSSPDGRLDRERDEVIRGMQKCNGYTGLPDKSLGRSAAELSDQNL
jgi:hypothetical protein